MATAVEAPMAIDRMSSNEPEQEPSRFTAVNGRSHSNSNASSTIDIDRGRGVSPAESNKRKRASSPAASSHSRKSADGSSPTETADETMGASPTQNGDWAQRQSAGSDNSDAQVAEALKGYDDQSSDASPNAGSPAGQQMNGRQAPPAIVRPGPGGLAPQLQKQRKRNFSNRTKTGCMTCRERKKKCDERKPTCLNCDRGGFKCKGYQPSNQAFKISREPPPQPSLHALQSKDAATAGYYHAQQAAMFYQTPMQPPLAIYEPRLEMQPGPPMIAPTNGTMPSQRNSISNPQPQSANPQPQSQPPPHASAWGPPPHGIVPQQQGPYDPMRAFAQLHQQPPHQPPPHLPTFEPAPQPGQHRSNSQSSINTQRTAQMALDYSRGSRPTTEKEKMLAGLPYQPKDPQLKKERHQCWTNVYRFNNLAGNPNDFQEDECREKFRKILEPEGPAEQPSGSPPKSSSSRVGKNVEVAAPFYCDYGYNITVGDNVEIGPNCRIMDSCSVEIGSGTVIGANVTILGYDGHNKGTPGPDGKRLLKGGKISIGRNVFVGAGSVIYPGMTINSEISILPGTNVFKSLQGTCGVYGTEVRNGVLDIVNKEGRYT